MGNPPSPLKMGQAFNTRRQTRWVVSDRKQWPNPFPGLAP
jgi:hypothetical protein